MLTVKTRLVVVSNAERTHRDRHLAVHVAMRGSWALLASHACTKFGSKGWEFATPLLLLLSVSLRITSAPVSSAVLCGQYCKRPWGMQVAYHRVSYRHSAHV